MAKAKQTLPTNEVPQTLVPWADYRVILAVIHRSKALRDIMTDFELAFIAGFEVLITQYNRKLTIHPKQRRIWAILGDKLGIEEYGTSEGEES